MLVVSLAEYGGESLVNRVRFRRGRQGLGPGLLKEPHVSVYAKRAIRNTTHTELKLQQLRPIRRLATTSQRLRRSRRVHRVRRISHSPHLSSLLYSALLGLGYANSICCSPG